MKYDVFISYSRKDSETVTRMYDALTKAGIHCFIDLKGIIGGADFPKTLAEAIEDSRLFLFVASENSYKSDFTRKEVAFADFKKVRIFPVIIDGSQLPNDLQLLFSNVNWRSLGLQYRIEKEFVVDVQKKLQEKSMYEPLRRAGRDAEKRLVRILVAALAVILTSVSVALFQVGRTRLKNSRMESDRVECRREIRLAKQMISRTDSLDLAAGIAASYLEEKACLDSAESCLSRTGRVLSGYPEDVLEDSVYGFTDIVRSLHDTRTALENRLNGYYRSLCREADLAADLYKITGDSADLHAAREAVERVLQVFPEDEPMLNLKQTLSL